MQGFSYYMPEVSSVAVYGGNDGNRYDQEFKSMKMGADVIIATPGRLRSHIKMGNVDLSRVSFFVLDEAGTGIICHYRECAKCQRTHKCQSKDSFLHGVRPLIY